MALKCIQIDNKFQVPVDGFYELTVPMYEIQSMYVSVYSDDGKMLQNLNRVCNYAFYFLSGETLTFKGSIILEENSKFKFKINRIGSSEETPEVVINQECTHDWKEYVGIINRFTYCSKCDVKRE